MFGENSSIVTKIREENPKCIFIKCVCHSMALCVSYFCKTLPRSVEQLVRDGHSYFSQSSKRTLFWIWSRSFREYL
nr:unnamed protein product [Callosobruchus analis]